MIMKNGVRIRGRMRLFSTGVEIEYAEPDYDESEGYYRYSYITMYPEMEAKLLAIHRYHWDLSPKNKRRRERSIRRSYRPSIFQSLGRTLRNIVNTLRDAFNRSLSLFLGKIGSRVAGGGATQDLNSVGSTLVEMAGNAYDPVLEKYIGRLVTVEMNEEGALKAYEGVLKEYSAKYMELVNVRYDVPFEIDEGKPVESALEPGIRRRYIDLIALRTLITLRHGGKKEKLSLKELLGLDNFKA